MIDFEEAVRGGLEEVFGNQSPQMQGCLFHFQQSLWRQIQALGLQQNYAQDAEFKRYVNMFGALAFVPEEEVIGSFDTLVNSLPQNYLDLLRNFIDYFEVRFYLSLPTLVYLILCMIY